MHNIDIIYFWELAEWVNHFVWFDGVYCLFMVFGRVIYHYCCYVLPPQVLCKNKLFTNYQCQRGKFQVRAKNLFAMKQNVQTLSGILKWIWHKALDGFWDRWRYMLKRLVFYNIISAIKLKEMEQNWYIPSPYWNGFMIELLHFCIFFEGTKVYIASQANVCNIFISEFSHSHSKSGPPSFFFCRQKHDLRSPKSFLFPTYFMWILYYFIVL